jgi:hypothetical protein
VIVAMNSKRGIVNHTSFHRRISKVLEDSGQKSYSQASHYSNPKMQRHAKLMSFNQISIYTNVLRSDFMSKVETIYIRFKTADIIGAGTDLEVYVGIGGREFYIESQRDFDDFERGDDRTYIIGDRPSTLPKNSEYIGAGDWSHYPIKTETLHFYPVYIRVESDIRWGGQTKPESWNTWYLDYVEIRVNPEKENITYCALDANDPESYIKLGLFDGRFLYLVQAPKQARIARKKIKVKKNSRKEKRS